MKKNSRIIKKILAVIIAIISVYLQIKYAGLAFNGATILAIFILIGAILIFCFDIIDIKTWIKEEFFKFEEGIDVIPFLDPSEYEGERKEGIIIKFPGSD